MSVNEINTMVKCNKGNFITVLNAIEYRFFEYLAFSNSMAMQYHLRKMNIQFMI